MRELDGMRVLVLGDYRQTVTVVRSLARAGLEVLLGCEEADSPSSHSRYVSATWVYGSSNARQFRAQLERHILRERPRLVFAVGESILRRMLPEAARLEPLAIWANPDAHILARCFDKRVLYALAPALGVPTLPWQPFTSAALWETSAAAMGFPVVIKRKDSAAPVAERKALIFADAGALKPFLGSLAADPDRDSLLLQKFAPGARHNCHIAAAGGRLVAYFEQKVLRTDEPDDTGIGTLGVSVAPSPVLRAHCERLARALDYTGVGCIQFLVDEGSGAAAFLEFNPRLDSTCVLPYRLGYDFPRLAVELALWRRARCGPAPSLEHAYAAGRRYHWLCGDLTAWRHAARGRTCTSGELARWAASMARNALGSHRLTFEWRDPLPTLWMFRRAFARPGVAATRQPLKPGALGKI